MNKEDQELYDKFVVYAAREWGNNQITMTVEESLELALSILHLNRGKADINDVISEIADVENMLGQLKYIYNIDDDDIDRVRIEKVKKVITRKDINLD